jgi:hypothetical protein
MKSITQSELDEIFSSYLSDASLSRKVISGINELCLGTGIIPLNSSQIASTYGKYIFQECESKLKDILFYYGSPYPSDASVVSHLRLPRLPSFHWQDQGNILPGVGVSGIGGFVFGTLAFGISAYKKAQMKKKNRITNFALVYNSLISSR